MSLIEHLEELRRRLIASAAAYLVAVPIAFLVRRQVLALILYPTHPAGQDVPFRLVALTPGEAFATDFKLSLLAAAVFASPIILYQVIAFIAPAMTAGERRLTFGILPLGLALFIAGMAFAHFVVLPPALGFLLSYGSGFVEPMISVGRFVGFVTSFVLPFGFMFELPLLVWLLAKIGLVTAAFLAHYRRAAVLIVFILAAVLTPSVDVVSQLLMAVPLLALYEISILIARWVAPRR